MAYENNGRWIVILMAREQTNDEGYDYGWEVITPDHNLSACNDTLEGAIGTLVQGILAHGGTVTIEGVNIC